MAFDFLTKPCTGGTSQYAAMLFHGTLGAINTL